MVEFMILFCYCDALSLSTTKPCLVYCKLCDCISGDGEVSVLPVLLTDSVSSLEESRAVVIGILTLVHFISL